MSTTTPWCNGTLCGRTWWIVLAAMLAAGCAGVDVLQPPEDDVTKIRERRKQEVVREYGVKRDFAEYQAALTAWNQQDVASCQETLQRLLQRNPNHLDAQLLAADVFMAGGRFREAFDLIERVLAAHPQDARVQYTMGLLLDATGQNAGAAVYYEQAAKLDPGNEVYAVACYSGAEPPGEAMVSSAHPNASVARGPEAVAGLAALVPDPTAAGVQSSQSVAKTSARAPIPGANDASTSLRFVAHAELADRSSHVDSAEAAALAAVGGLFRQGQAALAAGSPEAALAQFREAEALRPNDPQIPISAALQALQHNHPDLAVELLSVARRRFSGSAQVHRILGVAFYRLGDYRSSQVALQQALSLDKSSALAYFLMGCTLAKLGQSESAEAHWRQARTINPRYAARR